MRLIQVAVPSRERRWASYREFRERSNELVGRINGTIRHASAACRSTTCIIGSAEQLAALYRAADVMLVTPLRDGMNLVAKEYVASRVDEDGVLVLSEFAGAADELGEALIVNPYDIDGVADSDAARALTMPPSERQPRMPRCAARSRRHRPRLG